MARKNRGVNVKIKKYRIPESLQIVVSILAFSTVFGFVSNDDYHKVFDIPRVVRYNCDMLMGGWHPDVPLKVIEECRKKRENAKSY